MAGFKRGGFRGGGGGAFKKSNAKKRGGSDEEDNAPRASKKSKGDDEDEESTHVVPELKTDHDGKQYVGLNASGKRRITVSEFKGNPLIDIREFWTDDSGDLKPGKKGISLTIDQYNTFLAALPLIESALAGKKVSVVRPDFDADPSVVKMSEDTETGVIDEDKGDEEAVEKVDEENEEEEE